MRKVKVHILMVFLVLFCSSASGQTADSPTEIVKKFFDHAREGLFSNARSLCHVEAIEGNPADVKSDRIDKTIRNIQSGKAFIMEVLAESKDGGTASVFLHVFNEAYRESELELYKVTLLMDPRLPGKKWQIKSVKWQIKSVVNLTPPPATTVPRRVPVFRGIPVMVDCPRCG